MPLPGETKYSALRGLFIFLCLLLIAAASYRSCNRVIESHRNNASTLVPVATAPPSPSPREGSKPTPLPPPPKPDYKLNPISPTSSADPNYPTTIDECHRTGDNIRCSGRITNYTDAPTTIYLCDSTAVDDEGNSFFIGSFMGVDVHFAGFGDEERIMPNVPTKFIVIIPDPHRNVKAVNIQLAINTCSAEPPIQTLIFTKVPVQ